MTSPPLWCPCSARMPLALPTRLNSTGRRKGAHYNLYRHHETSQSGVKSAINLFELPSYVFLFLKRMRQCCRVADIGCTPAFCLGAPPNCHCIGGLHGSCHTEVWDHREYPMESCDGMILTRVNCRVPIYCGVWPVCFIYLRR